MTYIPFLSLALQRCELLVFAEPSLHPSRTSSTLPLSSPDRALRPQDTQAFLLPSLYSVQFQPRLVQAFPAPENSQKRVHKKFVENYPSPSTIRFLLPTTTANPQF
ncbi:hypothetical protein BDD12DRAFT_836257 [Trichophaea hybrida]|nr:hypothetical protein BDD12DRAFT_836257 [Trichophaea hybrida]